MVPVGPDVKFPAGELVKSGVLVLGAWGWTLLRKRVVGVFLKLAYLNEIDFVL